MRNTKALDVAMILVAVLFVALVITLIAVYLRTGQEMSTLTMVGIPALVGEAGFSTIIQTRKLRREERQEELEDRKGNQNPINTEEDDPDVVSNRKRED